MTKGGEEHHSVWTFEADSHLGDILIKVETEDYTHNYRHVDQID